jgi:hypothetical protein
MVLYTLTFATGVPDMDMTTISAALASGKIVKDLATTLVHERDRKKLSVIKSDLTEKVLELQAKLVEVYGAVISEREALGASLERLRDLESHEREKARYRLTELSAGRHVFAYRLRPASELAERADEDPHFACQPCLNVRKHTVVLRGGGGQESDGGVTLRCPACQECVSLNGGRAAVRVEPWAD